VLEFAYLVSHAGELAILEPYVFSDISHLAFIMCTYAFCTTDITTNRRGDTFTTARKREFAKARRSYSAWRQRQYQQSSWRRSVRGSPFFLAQQPDQTRAETSEPPCLDAGGPDNQDCGSTPIHPPISLPSFCNPILLPLPPGRPPTIRRKPKYVSATLVMTLDNAIRHVSERDPKDWARGGGDGFAVGSGASRGLRLPQAWFFHCYPRGGRSWKEEESWRDQNGGGRDMEITNRAGWN
jgi:hypothetical protein